MEQLSKKLASFLTKERPLICVDLGETTANIAESISDTNYCYIDGKIFNLNSKLEEITSDSLDSFQELTKDLLLALMPLTKITNVRISVGRNDGVERIHYKYVFTVYRSYLMDGKLNEDCLVKIVWLDETHIRVIPCFDEFNEFVNVNLNDEGYYEDSTSSFLGYQSRGLVEAVEKHVEYKSKKTQCLLDLMHDWKPSVDAYLKVMEYLNNLPEGTTPTEWQGGKVHLANIYLNQLVNDSRFYHFTQLLKDAGVAEDSIKSTESKISSDPLI